MTKKPGEIVRRDDLLRAAEVERDALAVDLLKSEDPDLCEAAAEFFGVVLAKLGRKHRDGKQGWAAPDLEGWTPADIRKEMINHAHKGDPIDVANYALFLWYHERRIAESE